MTPFTLIAILVTVTALLSYVNERFLRLPPTIGVTAAALFASLLIAGLGQLGLDVERWAELLLVRIDFDDVLLEGMLSFLLFAGALHVDLGDLLGRKWTILSLATIGVLLSTFLVGSLFWLLLGGIGLSVPFIYALLFGALISPTDPIAVLGILRRAGAPQRLESMVIGESLFNDGVGVVVFTLIAGLIAGGHELSLVGTTSLFLQEAVGGALLGLVAGYLAFLLLKTIDNYTVEILITLSLVTGGYALAGALHTSGPIAMVVAGLLIGNHGRVFAMTDRTRERLDTFWELIDEILNAVLFVLIGFEVLLLDVGPHYWLAGLAAIPLVLGARYVSVGLPLALLRPFRTFERHTVGLMTWAGIRGGISIALALSLPQSGERELILFATYAVVVFSILVQGLTVGRVVRWATARS
jgi:CPA1 family monovalent cation:H+ antiporter